jgi:hypothetical protein
MSTFPILSAAILAVSAAASSAAFADSPRSPLFAAGNNWNGGFAGPVNATGGGKAISSREFEAQARDTFAGAGDPRSTTVIRIAPAKVSQAAATGRQFADFSANRSDAN